MYLSSGKKPDFENRLQSAEMQAKKITSKEKHQYTDEKER